MILAFIGFNACGLSDSTEAQEVSISEDTQIESLGSNSYIKANISLGEASKSLYILLSNSAETATSSSITHNASSSSLQALLSTQAKSLISSPRAHASERIVNFSKNLKNILQRSTKRNNQVQTIVKSEDFVGDSTSFCTNINEDNRTCIETTEATAKKIISNISTQQGLKTLNVWVSDDAFDNGSGCVKDYCVTQEMVDALANTFLSTGDSNDIYDWVSAVYGEEWGTTPNTAYIDASNEITILLTDIDNDNSPNSGVVGFFWGKDNIKIIAGTEGSNERIMFYIDSVMFANRETGDDIDWEKEIYGTLAHEFQHMIHFYQKTVLLAQGEASETWINEMLSESTEDLIATKIPYNGPRAVDPLDGSAGEANNSKGRYPEFNENNTISLTTWDSQGYDYSKVSAFGAYLLRNYGGAKVLHDIMHNTFTDKQAVVAAVNSAVNGSDKTFSNLLSEWGTAVLTSDKENLENTAFYNTGDFTQSNYNDETYQLGSINFFNYSPQPSIQTSASTVKSEGNYYYKIGDNLTGDVSLSIQSNGQTEATLIAK